MRSIIILLFAIPSLCFADMKQITCERDRIDSSGETDYRKFVAVLDTDDFSKENPEYEYTFADLKIGGETPARYAAGLGEVTRQSFEVTPSTISLRYCSPGFKEMYPNCMGSSGDMATYFNVKRDTLETDNGYKCTLEDYENKNQI